MISFIAAAMQALTAVALVALLLFGLNASGLQINAWSNKLESASYAMIALLGVYLLVTQLLRLWRSWRGARPRSRGMVMPGIITTITPTTIRMITITITTSARSPSITITRRERRAITSSMRGSSPDRSRGGR